MIVTLDGRKLDSPAATPPDLRALIDQVRSEHSQERLIVSVSLNGELIPNESIDRFLTSTLEPSDQVDLESADTRQLTADALREAAEHVAAAGRRQIEIADQINTGQIAEAMNEFTGFVEVWQIVRDTLLQSCDVLGRDLTLHEHEGMSLLLHLGQVSETLRELRNALDNRDFVLLADLIHYEVPPMCEKWGAILQGLSQAVATGR